MPLEDADLERIHQERRLMHALGAVSFPTLVFEAVGQQIRLTGARRYPALEAALMALDEDTAPSTTLEPVGSALPELDHAVTQVLHAYGRATTREVASAVGPDDTATVDSLNRIASRTGLLWSGRPHHP